jgi:RNA polymerase sigma-70 factor (ECF subfamily)
MAGAFDRLTDRLRRGDEDAAAEVFHRFAHRLIALARSQLDTWVRTRVEAEDVVQSVFRSFFTRFGTGQFQLNDWDSFWAVLTLITVRKCANRIEFCQAAKRDPRRKAHPPKFHDRPVEALDRAPTPSEAAILSETLGLLLKQLPPRDRDILTLHLQGHDIAAISAQVRRTERTVRRTLERARRILILLQTDADQSR